MPEKWAPTMPTISMNLPTPSLVLMGSEGLSFTVSGRLFVSLGGDGFQPSLSSAVAQAWPGPRH